MLGKLLNWLAHRLGYVQQWLNLPVSWYTTYAKRKAENAAHKFQQVLYDACNDPSSNVTSMPPKPETTAQKAASPKVKDSPLLK